MRTLFSTVLFIIVLGFTNVHAKDNFYINAERAELYLLSDSDDLSYYGIHGMRGWSAEVGKKFDDFSIGCNIMMVGVTDDGANKFSSSTYLQRVDYEMDLDSYMLNGNYTFSRFERVSFFLTAGVGIAHIEESYTRVRNYNNGYNEHLKLSSSADTGLCGKAGLGVEIILIKNLSLKIDCNYFRANVEWLDMNSVDSMTASLGLRYNF